MPPKKKPTNRESNPDNVPFQMVDAGPPDPLAEIFAQYPNANRKIKVGKYVGTGIEHCFSTSDLIDEDFLQEHYGGGRYKLRIFIDGIMQSEVEMRIAQKLTSGGVNATTGAGAAPLSSGSSSDGIAPAKTAENTHQTFLETMLLKMVGVSPAQQSTPVNELAEAMKTISSLNGNGNQNAAAEFTNGLKAGIELAKDMGGGGGGDWKSELFRMVKDSIPHIAGTLPLMMGGNKTQVSVAPTVASVAAPVNAISEEQKMSDTMHKMLYDGIQKLKGMCLNGAPVDLIIDWVLANANQPQYQDFIRAAFSIEFDAFATIDPEIIKPPFADWFRKLYDGLRHEFKPADEVDNGNDGTTGD